ncbi:MAG: Bug family tripartite tricarboxylate transporter substrate binding protein [Burkholderiaceae bacterium]
MKHRSLTEKLAQPTRITRRQTLGHLGQVGLFGTAAALGVPGLLGSASALAQAYPSRPIKVIVGFTPGGAVDLVAHTLTQAMAGRLGQPMVVENRPGVGTKVAMKALIESAPDGHTLMLTANSIAANPALYKPAPFDPGKDVMPVSLVGRVPVVIAANAASPYASVGQLIQAAKGRPNGIAYGSPGNGTTPHMALEFFTRAAGIDLQHVPYRGGSQAITDVIGGQLPLVAVNALEVLPHVRSGKLRVLAVLSPNRSPIFPEVPTIAESGYAGFEASVWYGFIAPAGTPQSVVARLHGEVQKALQTQEVRDRLANAGGEVLPGSSAQFGQLIRSELARYERLVREANIQPD